MLHRILMLILASLLFLSTPKVQSSSLSMEEIGQKAVKLACTQLNITPEAEHIVCLTNAGYATVAGRSSRALFDILPGLSNISIGRGNLLSVYDAYHAPLWLAFAKKGPGRQLMMVNIRMQAQKLEASSAVNVRVDKETPFKPFQRRQRMDQPKYRTQ